MDKTLRAEVESDISNISSSKLGAITTLRYIIKRMVIKNQEFLNALENYIKTFDITKFPGKYVPIACLCLKAVAKALGKMIFLKMSFARFLKVSPNHPQSLLMNFAQAKLHCVAAVLLKTLLEIHRSTANLSAFLPILKIPI